MEYYNHMGKWNDHLIIQFLARDQFRTTEKDLHPWTPSTAGRKYKIETTLIPSRVKICTPALMKLILFFPLKMVKNWQSSSKNVLWIPGSNLGLIVDCWLAICGFQAFCPSSGWSSPQLGQGKKSFSHWVRIFTVIVSHHSNNYHENQPVLCGLQTTAWGIEGGHFYNGMYNGLLSSSTSWQSISFITIIMRQSKLWHQHHQ